MNVVIYARYSSHNQTEQSIEGQIAVCTEYAQRNNYTIVGEYIDRALTGTNDNRPQFQKMIEDSNKKYFQGVLVYQLDRFARNRYDSATYKNKLKKNGVRVFSAKENISEDASGILMESVLEGMAEYYSVELSQKVKRGMKINAERGLYNGGSVPLGLKIDKNKRYKIDEEKAEVVRNIFDMYINGWSMIDIIKYLNKKNIKASNGNEFNINSIRRILLNSKYIGTYSFDGIEIKNAIPAIINEEVFKKVRERMEKNKRAPARSKAKVEYLLTTKLFCGTCKEMMVGISGTSKTKRIYYYYSCNGRRERICNRKNVPKEWIEDIVVQEAINILTEDNINKIAKEVEKAFREDKKHSHLNYLDNKLKENEKQKSNLLESLKICEIDSVRKSIFGEIQKLEKDTKEIEDEIFIERSQHINISASDVKFFLEGIKNGKTNDIKQRKMIINVLINSIYLYDDELTIIFNIKDGNYNKRIKMPSIDKIESSFLKADASPSYNNLQTI